MDIACFDTIGAMPEDLVRFWNAQTGLAFDQTLVWNQLFAERVTAQPTLLLTGRLANLQPQFILPLERETAKFLGLPLLQVNSLTNYYSAHYAFIGNPDAETAAVAVDALVTKLREPGFRWHTLNLQPLATDSAFYAALLDKLAVQGWPVFPYFKFGNWHLPVENRSFDAYFDSLSSQLRNTLKRKRKKLEKEHRTELVIASSPADLDRHLAAYTRVYKQSWKIPEPHLDFIYQVARAFADRNWLRLGIAYVNDTPAAAQMWFVQNGTAYIFKLAYDEQFRNYSVGSILSAELFRHAIDVDGVHTIDYLCGDDVHKQSWMTHRRERWGMLACNTRTLTGNLITSRHGGAKLVKRFLRKQAD